MKKTVYAYIRVSTVKQGTHGSSLQEQQAAIRHYAVQHELDIVEWFEEQQTAAKGGRPIFNRMFKLLNHGKASGVVIHKIDRSARNLKDWADLGGLIDRGVEVHFAHESLDLKSRGGRLAADIQAVVAADFIRNHRDEVRKGMRGRFRQGLYPLRAPLGYLDCGKGQPKALDPEMAPLVKRTFELYATGSYSLYQLGQTAYAFGLRNRVGNRVTRNGLSTLLNNEFYMGIMRLKHSGERFPGIHPPLVSSELFECVQNILNGRTPHRNIKHEFLFRRLLKCQSCGYNLRGELKGQLTYYRCHNRSCPTTCVREDVIMDQAEHALIRLQSKLGNGDALAGELQKLMAKRQRCLADHIRAAQLRLGNVERRLARLTDGYLEEVIDRATYLDRQQHLLQERTAAQEALDAYAVDIDPLADKVKRFIHLLSELQSVEKSLPYIRVRDLLQATASKISVDRKNLLIDWKNAFRSILSFDRSHECRHYRDTGRRSVNIRDRYPSDHSKNMLAVQLIEILEK